LEINIGERTARTIVSAIQTYVNGRLRSLPYDVTRQGRVTAVLGGDKYSVNVQGTIYTVPCATGQTFAVNESVLVLFAGNDWNRRYVVGKA
jgi:hypothetical protein